MRATTIELIERLIEIMSRSNAKHSVLRVKRGKSRQRFDHECGVGPPVEPPKSLSLLANSADPPPVSASRS